MEPSKYAKIVEGYQILLQGNDTALRQLLGKMIHKHPNTFLELMNLDTDDMVKQRLQEAVDAGDKKEIISILRDSYEQSLSEATEYADKLLED